jgi:hypothetical protein
MTTCRGCGALVQPEWDRCKICGYDGSEPIDEAPAGRGRRARKAEKRARPAAPPPEPVASPVATMARPAPDLFLDEPPPSAPRTSGRDTAGAAVRRSTSGRQSPLWLIGLALVAVIAGCLVIIFKDPDEAPPPSDVPAAESDPADGPPVWESLGEWDGYTSPGGGLSVELPGPPVEELQTLSVLNVGSLDLERASVITSGASLTVASAVIPEGVRDRPDLVLDGLVRAEASEVHGVVAATKDVTVDGMPAVRVRVTSTGGEVRFVAVSGPERAYLLQAEADDQSTVYLQRLIDTFDS